jgi:hypothetical protein
MRGVSLLGMVVAVVVLAAVAVAQVNRVAPAEDVTLYLITPVHGEVITGTFVVRFGLRGMGIAPAGVDFANTGHLHLLINLPLEEVDLDAPLPFTDQTRHLGGGQTELRLDLPPGEYTLQAMLADWLHVSFNPPVVSEVIRVTVR